MKSKLFSIGLNHDTAPLSVREKVSFSEDKLAVSNKRLLRDVAANECLILSTCNRTEVHACTTNPSLIVDWLANYASIDRNSLIPHLYTFEGEKAMGHVARVASGMNSMVLGETQIFGQMKTAFREAEISGSVGKVLRKVFHTAFSVAKEIRSTTEIGVHSISMAAASLRLVDRIFVDSSTQNVLFIGAGEMINLFGEHYSSRKFGHLCFANRTVERAVSLARKYGGVSCNLSSVISSQRLGDFDIVISCTSSPIPILGKGVIEESVLLRRHKPLILIDLAVPRDIEVSVADLDDVFLFSVDDLGDIVREGFSKRRLAVEEADNIIDEVIDHFADWMRSDVSVDILKKFRSYGSNLVATEFEKSVSAIRKNKDPEEILRDLCNSLEKKFLDRPSRVLNKAQGSQRDELSRALTKLFNLDDQI